MTIQTYDEILTLLCDTFDSFIAPQKLSRSDSNTIYLELKSLAKGIEVYVNSSASVVNNKFDPDKCDDFDLESIARLSGTRKRTGKGSGLPIVIANDDVAPVTIFAGEYYYQYSADISFKFSFANDTSIPASSSIQKIAFTDVKGSTYVTEQSSLIVRRTDASEINPSLSFSCLDNASMLGALDESNIEFRSRVLSDPDRQDIFSEMEEALRALPRILDVRVIFNDTNDPIVVDSITIQPFHFLLTINGDITSEVANTVVQFGYYPSTQVSASDYVSFASPVFSGGAYKVFYKNFDFFDYGLVVDYEYDPALTSEEIIQDAIAPILLKYQYPSRHSPIITEGIFYEELKAVLVPSFTVLDVTLSVEGSPTSYVNVPRTRYPRLASITLNGGT